MAPKQLPRLTREQLKIEAAAFAKAHARHSEPALLGLDYPVVEPYYLHRFKTKLAKRYQLPEAKPDDEIMFPDITFPDIKVDVKFINDLLNDSYHMMLSPTQMFYGMGYDVLLFVYHQQSDFAAGTAWLNIQKAVWAEDYRTADWLSTVSLLKCLSEKSDMETLLSFFESMHFPIHPGEVWKLAEYAPKNPPKQGYASISRAMKSHVRWGKVIREAGKVDGILRLM